jgi:outer membrane receptor protein involved in Fe transport
VPVSVCDANLDGIVDGTTVAVATTGEVDPDSVDSYEIGGKLSFLDRKLAVDAFLFRMDWSDIPVATTLPCGWQYTANASKARSQGVEVQATLRVSEAFRVELGGSYTDAELTEDAPTLGALAGARLPTPRVNASLGVQYEFGIAGRPAAVRADAIHVGSFSDNVTHPLYSDAGDYVKIDASARIVLSSIDINFFVRNLTNEDAFTYRGGSFYSEFYGYRLRPRTVGLELSYGF